MQEISYVFARYERVTARRSSAVDTEWVMVWAFEPVGATADAIGCGDSANPWTFFVFCVRNLLAVISILLIAPLDFDAFDFIKRWFLFGEILTATG